jgi:hypothetical protein
MPDFHFWDYMDQLREKFPGFLESLSPEDLEAVRDIARKAAAQGWHLPEFNQRVQQNPIYTNWNVPPEEEVLPGEEVPPDLGVPAPGTPGSPVPLPDDRDDIRDLLVSFLNENELPSTLIGFITDALAAKKSYAQIVAELRETPEYKSAYPENDVRRSNGFEWMPEAQIRAYRSEAKRIAQAQLGFTISDDEVAKLLTNNKSLAEWEQSLRTWQDFERWGPTVRAVFENELGYSIADDRVFAFLAPFVPTPELDVAYERALMRARPAVLGIGVRPEDEAEMLRRYGISVEQAFRGYQGIVSELPRTERMAAIEAEISRNVEQYPTGSELFAGTPFATLFRAIQLQDPEALAQLQGNLSREVARFQAGGGPTQGGVGLLSPTERAAL